MQHSPLRWMVENKRAIYHHNLMSDGYFPLCTNLFVPLMNVLDLYVKIGCNGITEIV